MVLDRSKGGRTGRNRQDGRADGDFEKTTADDKEKGGAFLGEWKRELDADGHIYYVNTRTEQTSRCPPDGAYELKKLPNTAGIYALLLGEGAQPAPEPAPEKRHHHHHHKTAMRPSMAVAAHSKGTSLVSYAWESVFKKNKAAERMEQIKAANEEKDRLKKQKMIERLQAWAKDGETKEPTPKRKWAHVTFQVQEGSGGVAHDKGISCQVEIKDGKTCNVLDSVKIPLVRGRGTLKTFEVAKEPAIISISFWKDVKGVRKAYGVIEDMLLDKDFLQWFELEDPVDDFDPLEQNDDIGQVKLLCSVEKTSASEVNEEDSALLAPGWEAKVTPEGRILYVNNEKQQTQWSHPGLDDVELPEGWEKSVDDQGRAYYINTKSGKTGQGSVTAKETRAGSSMHTSKQEKAPATKSLSFLGSWFAAKKNRVQEHSIHAGSTCIGNNIDVSLEEAPQRDGKIQYTNPADPQIAVAARDSLVQQQNSVTRVMKQSIGLHDAALERDGLEGIMKHRTKLACDKMHMKNPNFKTYKGRLGTFLRPMQVLLADGSEIKIGGWPHGFHVISDRVGLSNLLKQEAIRITGGLKDVKFTDKTQLVGIIPILEGFAYLRNGDESTVLWDKFYFEIQQNLDGVDSYDHTYLPPNALLLAWGHLEPFNVHRTGCSMKPKGFINASSVTNVSCIILQNNEIELIRSQHDSLLGVKNLYCLRFEIGKEDMRIVFLDKKTCVKWEAMLRALLPGAVGRPKGTPSDLGQGKNDDEKGCGGNPMKVVVKSGEEAITIDVMPNDTIDMVKRKIQKMVGIHPEKQHLSFAGNELEGRFTLTDYGPQQRLGHLAPEVMARAGFIFAPVEGRPDRVFCPFCCLELHGLKCDDDVFAMHVSASKVLKTLDMAGHVDIRVFGIDGFDKHGGRFYKPDLYVSIMYRGENLEPALPKSTTNFAAGESKKYIETLTFNKKAGSCMIEVVVKDRAKNDNFIAQLDLDITGIQIAAGGVGWVQDIEHSVPMSFDVKDKSDRYSGCVVLGFAFRNLNEMVDACPFVNRTHQDEDYGLKLIPSMGTADTVVTRSNPVASPEVRDLLFAVNGCKTCHQNTCTCPFFKGKITLRCGNNFPQNACDPYCIISYGGNVMMKTKDCKATHSPKWDEDFYITVPTINDCDALLLEFWDGDSGDFLGSALMSSSEVKEMLRKSKHDGSRTLVLINNKPVIGHDKLESTVQLLLNCEHLGENSFKGKIIVASGSHLSKMDFIGKCDSYCVVTYGSTVMARTKTCFKEFDPVWNESIDLTVQNLDKCASLLVQVFDRDEGIGDVDDLIGSILISGTELKEMLRGSRKGRKSTHTMLNSQPVIGYGNQQSTVRIEIYPEILKEENSDKDKFSTEPASLADQLSKVVIDNPVEIFARTTHAVAHQDALRTHRRRMQTVTSGSAGAEKGSKMLEYACANNIQGVMDLLGGGVPVDFTDGALRTALHWASAFGNEEIVKLLIDRGANPNARSVFGLTPLDLAEKGGFQVCAFYIQVNGGKQSTR